jgi:carboxylesterase type B
VFKQDEFECLNLNITCPADHHSESRLPVMVWIHG